MGRNPLDWMSRMLEVPSNAKFKKKKKFLSPIRNVYVYIQISVYTYMVKSQMQMNQSVPVYIYEEMHQR